ncbi:MAG: family 20 glycosylhydrolase [Propionibacteriaceae bacterium]|nr:family 20 glycosylhydrolase [Propionibacteriaceae bacterium]
MTLRPPADESATNGSLIPDPEGPPAPAHEWRGLLLDSARTFWSVDEVCEILDLMARYRLNRLHWHLTDDAAWRFDVPGYARVVEVGAHLPREPFTWYTNVDPGKRDDVIGSAPEGSTSGWYTDEDVTRVVEHAARLGIRVMPEMDLPGHMAAVIKAYPELGDPALADLPPSEWTHRNDLLWPSPAADDFLRAALQKVCALFPFPVVHIGGDECDYRVWEADGALMQQMADEGVEDARALQGRFTSLARATLTDLGRGIAAWDEVTETPCVGDELIFGWREGVGVPAAQGSGNPWVLADADVLYLNRLGGPVESERAGMYGTISVRDILDIEVPDDDQLQGIQAAAWCEFMPDRAALHYHLFPRLLAVAELAWCGSVTAADFEGRLSQEAAWLAEHGVHGRPIDKHTWRSTPRPTAR